MPDKLCYMDLLVEGQAVSGNNNKFTDPEYDQSLVSALRDYHEDGMNALLVNQGGNIPFTSGDIICPTNNGKCTLRYGYRVPDRFKIIVVSSAGDIVVSKIIETDSFNSTVNFDYKSGKAETETFFLEYLIYFLFTCLFTLLTESVILYLFKFNVKENLKLFLTVNIATQIFLYIMISTGMKGLGILGAAGLFMLAEFIIFIAEAFLFAKLLKQHSVRRRVLCSITSNFASIFSGVLAVWPIMSIYNLYFS